MTPSSINIIQGHIPLLREIGPALTQHFYQRLFSAKPELESAFDMEAVYNGSQPTELFQVLINYLENVDSPERCDSIINGVATHPTTLAINTEQYDAIGAHLVETIKYFFGGELQENVEMAWTEAFWQFADRLEQKRAAQHIDKSTA